jgi:uncharacterized protein involved in oxidation of intracellular sulfur
MTTLFILNDPPYGTERVYNALRLAHALLKKAPQVEVSVFLMADYEAALMVGTRRSTMDELAAMTAEADKVLVF